jgi:hypothetical protein
MMTAKLSPTSELIVTTEDLHWLRDVHGIDILAPNDRIIACAIMHGNADCPEKVELFRRDNINEKPFRVYEYNDETCKLEIVKKPGKTA